jgi:chromosome segregation ATPase
MLNEDILDQALVKKNKEIDLLNERNERMKQEFNVEKRNLSNKINSLQKKMDQIKEETKNEKRVQIINKLREERKDQEQTILLLRKYILNSVDQENKEEEELKINKYLIQYRKEKFGEQRYISYEELKIKFDELEKSYMSLKKAKGVAPSTTRSYLNPKEKTKKIPESEIQLLVVKRFKTQLDEYDLKIRNLENENNLLKSQKEDMENKQKDMIEKFKQFNEDMTQMKGIYNDIEQELKVEADTKVNELKLKLAKTTPVAFKQNTVLIKLELLEITVVFSLSIVNTPLLSKIPSKKRIEPANSSLKTPLLSK